MLGRGVRAAKLPSGVDEPALTEAQISDAFADIAAHLPATYTSDAPVDNTDKEKIAQNLDRSLMLVTALVPHLGYDKSAILAKKAYEEGKSLKQVALETGLVSDEDFDRWVKAQEMTMIQQSPDFNQWQKRSGL
jgi:fumarate hydratase class II